MALWSRRSETVELDMDANAKDECPVQHIVSLQRNTILASLFSKQPSSTMRTYSLIAAALAVELTTGQDLASTLASQDTLSSLVDLLGQYPDTTEFLASQQAVTLFAPNNDAIASLTQSGDLDPATVDQVLRYHLYSGVIQAEDISDVPQFAYSYFASDDLVTGGQVASVSLDQEGNAVVTSGEKTVSQVITADITFDNGIIHIVDSMLRLPSSVSETLVAGGLTALAGAATELDLVSTLEGLGDVTIFAPSNDAFRAIAGAAAGLQTAQLTEILQYHIISGTVVYSTLLGNTSVPTLQGTTVDIAISPEGAVFVDGARVINSDVLVANGVLHVIDAVLNPDEENPQPDEPGFPTGDSDTVPFTPSEQAGTSVKSELSGTTSFVAEILVTAAPEPTTYLLPNLSLSTAAAGTGAVANSPTTSAAASVITTSASGAGSDTASSNAASSSEMASRTVSSDAASSASEVPPQQTENAGTRKEWSAVGAAVVAFGVGACALGL